MDFSLQIQDKVGYPHVVYKLCCLPEQGGDMRWFSCLSMSSFFSLHVGWTYIRLEEKTYLSYNKNK